MQKWKCTEVFSSLFKSCHITIFRIKLYLAILITGRAMGSPVNRKNRWRWTLDSKIVGLALLSRVVILSLSVLMDLILPDHQPDASVARPENLELPHWLMAFTRWDAAHFLNIANLGYQEEKDFAFFPLLPIAINAVACTLHAMRLSWSLSLLFAGLFIANGSFVLSAWLLFRLGLASLQDHVLAFNAARLFCLCPANIFLSTIYTESPFAACTFGALLLLHLDYFYLSAAVFAIGSGLRSNGLVNIGFICFHVLLSTLKQLRQGDSSYRVLRATFRLVAGTVIVLLPFFAFQAFAVWKECGRVEAAGQMSTCEDIHEQCTVSAEPDLPLWCQSGIPSAYSHIQAKYWQGGFLRYWQLKQIPNFLLAAPSLILTAAGVSYLLMDFFKELQKGSKKPIKLWISTYLAVLRCPLLPHAIHWGFLAMYVFFCANVQISTRLLASACPVFHWFLASIVFDRNQYCRPFLKLYIGIYNFLGIIMHVNFLPWTWNGSDWTSPELNRRKALQKGMGILQADGTATSCLGWILYQNSGAITYELIRSNKYQKWLSISSDLMLLALVMKECCLYKFGCLLAWLLAHIKNPGPFSGSWKSLPVAKNRVKTSLTMVEMPAEGSVLSPANVWNARPTRFFSHLRGCSPASPWSCFSCGGWGLFSAFRLPSLLIYICVTGVKKNGEPY